MGLKNKSNYLFLHKIYHLFRNYKVKIKRKKNEYRTKKKTHDYIINIMRLVGPTTFYKETQ